MKLVFIGNTAWSMYNFRRSIFQYFINEGHEVIIISPIDNSYQNLLEGMGCKCHTVNIDAKGNNPLRDMRTMYQIRQILRSEHPDCCFLYTIKANIYGGISAMLLNIPYVAITTGLGYTFLIDNWVSRVAKLLYKIAFRKAKRVWFLNQEDADSFKKEHLVCEDKIEILSGEGIDVDRFEVHHELSEISFLVVARMLWDKGIGEFVEAAQILKEKYPNVKFKLLGFLGVDNPSAISKQQMNDWIRAGFIEYLGVTDDVRPFLYNSSCVVLPSYREGIPFSLMEGAAAGKPLVATNSIGCKEVVDDGITGFLCNIKDVKSLAQCMEKIILMPIEERIKMGLLGRQLMQSEFGIDCILEKYIHFLKTLEHECSKNSNRESNDYRTPHL